MNEKNNVFTTPTYELKNFKDKKELEGHLEFKINAVIEVHASIWTIDKVDRKVTDTTASAKIYMTRK